jgi:uncharacterized membrane-anchored protein
MSKREADDEVDYHVEMLVESSKEGREMAFLFAADEPIQSAVLAQIFAALAEQWTERARKEEAMAAHEPRPRSKKVKKQKAKADKGHH